MKTYAQKYADFFETISPQTNIEGYKEFFCEESTFEDPFQKVKGVDAICNVFLHMYATLYKPKFEILEVIEQENIAYIQWNFLFALDESKEMNSFVGLSRVEFRNDGKVISHVDYWDAAQHVYEKIPLLGTILRWIKRRIHA